MKNMFVKQKIVFLKQIKMVNLQPKICFLQLIVLKK